MSFDQELQDFMAAIRQVESGGRYDIMGTDHGSKYGVARGAYQIMSEIWPGWAKEAGLAGANWRDPAAQDAVARHKMTQYYRKYGDWRLVAAAWFGGMGAANKLQRQGEKGVASIADGFGTTVPEYVQRVVSQLGNVNSADRAMMSSAVAESPTQTVNPLEQQATGERDELRKTYAEVLDNMSQIIAGNPERFESMYGPDPEMVTGTESEAV